MTEMDLSGLESLKGRQASKKKPEWQPLDLNSLHGGTYLAADQSLSAFGIVLFEVAPDGGCAVHMSGKFSTDPGSVGGWEDTLTRAANIQAAVHAWLLTWIIGKDWGAIKVVHEAPPIGRGKLVQPEISLITAFAFRNGVRLAWKDQDRAHPQLLQMVRRQDHAKLICGNGNAKKPVHHAELKYLFPGIRGAAELITNEAHRDALSVALTAAHRGY